MLGPYQLGPNNDENQGIYTGDARELAKAIPDESVDLVLTDPPFGIGFQYNSDFYNDNRDGYLELVTWIVTQSNRIIRPGGLCFVFQAMSRLRETWQVFPDDSRLFAACKNFVQMRSTPIQYSFDPVIFWQKEGQYGRDYKGRDYHIGNCANTKNRGLDEAGFHVCPRPLSTILYMIENFSPSNSIICDLFVGSGTTAVAAKLLKRRWLAFEIDPDVAERARERVKLTQPPLFVPEMEQAQMM